MNSLLSHLPPSLVYAGFSVGILALLSYFVPFLWQAFFLTEQDLKEKYGAQWAVVTGGSSGIGAAIVEKLAKQHINVVIVALEDAVLDGFHAEMTSRYPSVSFRKVPIDLSKPDAVLSAIRSRTDDITVNLLFNNAGFITTGPFCNVPLDRNMANFHCNATSVIPLTHHYVSKMIERGQKGLVAFTGSGAGFIPCPLSSIYGATKVFLNSFAASLAAELASDGIDVLCINPSPVQSRFYENAGKMDALRFFQKTAVQPETIADAMFASAGRVVIRDLGYFSAGAKLILKALDWNLLAEIFKVAIPKNADFIRMRTCK